MSITTVMHEAIAAGIRDEIEVLERKIERLRVVAEYHAEHVKQVKVDEKDESSRDRNRALPATASGASGHAGECATILRRAGKPMRAGDIARALQDSGQFTHLDHRHLSNALYTAMTRRAGQFVKKDGLWSLMDAGQE